MNEELINLIKEKTKEGKSKGEIKNLFLSQGYSAEEIEQCFSFPSEVDLKLPGVVSLIKGTLLIYRKKLIVILGISSVTLLIGLALNFLLYFLPKENILNINISDSFNFGLFFYLSISVFSAIVAIIFQAWSYLALIYAIRDNQENVGIKQSYILSWNNILSYWWIAFLMGAISTCGFFLLIIPGIIFSIWFLFAPIILVMEGIKGMEALLKSKYYVKGKLVSLLWRFFAVFSVIFMLFGLLYFITNTNSLLLQAGGTIFSFIFFPFLIIYYFLIYTYLKKAKSDSFFIPDSKEKKIFIFVVILGIFLPILLTIGSLFLVKQAFTVWDRALDAKRTNDIQLINTAMNIYYQDKGQYPEITVTNGRINLSNIGQNLTEVPSDPGLGKIKGCNDVQGAPYFGFANTLNRDKYCIFACLSDGSFLSVSQNGVKILNKIPFDLDCQEEKAQKESETATNEALDWKTYINNEYEFEMRYPESSFFPEPKMESFDCAYLNFSEQCPYIKLSGSNIENDQDLESAVSKGLLKIEKININDTDYCLQQSSEVAAGSIYTTYYYTALKDGKCVSLNFVLHDVNDCIVFGLPGEEKYKECENGKILREEILNKIISTFKFSE